MEWYRSIEYSTLQIQLWQNLVELTVLYLSSNWLNGDGDPTYRARMIDETILIQWLRPK